MGRRSLPRIDPRLDLGAHYLDPDQAAARPFDRQLLFGRAAPLEIEVGSGKGLFLDTASAACPEHDFLGIELAHKYARFIAARLARQGRANARVLCADALRVFAEWLPAEAAAAVHVYFPDPWWKKRHRKRRVMTGPFVADVQRVLQPGGRLHFWTDVDEYFASSLEIIAAATSLEGPFAVEPQPARHHLDYRTHFERRMRLHDLPVYRAEFRKPPSAAAVPL